MHTVDYCVLMLVTYEVPSLVFSQYRANSVRTSWTILLAILVFFGVRLTIRTARQKAILSGLLGVGGVALALSALVGFRVNAQTLQATGLIGSSGISVEADPGTAAVRGG